MRGQTLPDSVETESPRRPLWPVGIVALSVAGLLVSGYLASLKYGGSLKLCEGLGGCDVVNASQYSWVGGTGGLPVAVLGLGGYAVLLMLALWAWRAADDMPTWLPLVIFGISLIGVLYSAYLTYLELFVIYAVCPWCVASAVIMAAIFALSVRGVTTVAG